MNDKVKACALLNNMIVEYKDKKGYVNFVNIASITIDSEVIAIKSMEIVINPYDAFNFFRSTVEGTQDRAGHKNLLNILSDPM